MMNKRIPDWLNSALWSTPSPHDDAASAEAPPLIPPPAAESPTQPPVSSPDAKHETRDPLSTASENYVSACCSDEEDGRSSENSTPPAETPPAAKDISRQNQILSELSRKVINIGEIRRLALQGLPDGAGIRSIVWKVLLGYLPADRSLWPLELAKKRSQYQQFKEELLVNPSEIARRLEESSPENHELDGGSPRFLSRSEISHGEHPLSLGKTSIWNQFFQETEVVEQIDRDVMRTHPDIHFFSGDSTFAKSNQEALRSILIVFAKLNPGIRYVQGMNEILAPLYYIFKSDPDEENAASAEADTFFCFVELLSGFRDNFVQQLDNSVVGIRATITRLSQLLKDHDEELWRHLEFSSKAEAWDMTHFMHPVTFGRSSVDEYQPVNPQFYAFRWITLLLTQEFSFADSLLIWDTLLSDPDGPQETLLRVCCAMLVIVRKRLLAGDFTSNLKLLQNYPPTNISHLLYVANKLRVL